MKKLLFPLFMAVSLTLTGCQQNVTSDKVKSKLEKKEYRVEVISKAEAEVRIQSLNWNVEVKDVLIASKEPEALTAFFCVNIDDATKFVEENVAILSTVAQYYGENTKVGSHNNVAYVGTEAAISDAGLTAGK